jgi:hypothetical protein
MLMALSFDDRHTAAVSQKTGKCIDLSIYPFFSSIVNSLFEKTGGRMAIPLLLKDSSLQPWL